MLVRGQEKKEQELCLVSSITAEQKVLQLPHGKLGEKDGSLFLHVSIDTESVHATFENGLLQIAAVKIAGPKAKPAPAAA